MINYTKRAHAQELIAKELEKSRPDHRFVTFLMEKYNIRGLNHEV